MVRELRESPRMGKALGATLLEWADKMNSGQAFSLGFFSDARRKCRSASILFEQSMKRVTEGRIWRLWFTLIRVDSRDSRIVFGASSSGQNPGVELRQAPRTCHPHWRGLPKTRAAFAQTAVCLGVRANRNSSTPKWEFGGGTGPRPCRLAASGKE